MKKLFVDVSPGFYKNRLFTALGEKMDIMVVYTTGYDFSSRNEDFLKGSRNYPYVQLHGSVLSQCVGVLRIMRSDSFDQIVAGGYDSLVTWVSILFSSKQKNALLLESTFRETKTNGIKSLLKKIFFSRLSVVYACGTPHEKLARMFGFDGECRLWNSVGLINVVSQPPYRERKKVSGFLFVGRLIWQKNLEWLIKKFNEHPELKLTIVGFGELESKLKSLIVSSNIEMVGAVNNLELHEYYQKADVFILPSISETWGLVIEEALNNGTPIMCSHMVGCADDLVISHHTGVVFDLNDDSDFEAKLKEITDISKYNGMRKRISELNFEQHEKFVVDAFIC